MLRDESAIKIVMKKRDIDFSEKHFTFLYIVDLMHQTDLKTM